MVTNCKNGGGYLNNTQRKGFTLIELLAVIVILAVIALIATPIILNMIESAKKSASVDSAYGYIEAMELSNSMSMINDEYQEIKSTDTLDEINSKVKVKGTRPTEITNLTIEDGQIKSVSMCIGGYEVEYKNGKATAQDKCGSGSSEKVVYKEDLLNGADPVVKNDLIPVTIADDGVVSKADIYSEWYSYANKKWANAVILTDTGKVEEDGTIKEENIKEYYVWIPKYAYKLWNVNSDSTDNVGQPIEITFGSKAKTTGTNNGDTYIHPAFTNFNTNGIWVGKFEISYDEETYTDKTKFLTTNPNYASATDSSKLLVKPNVRSLTNKNVSSLYTIIKESHTDLNSHMMTNMEWGATAYLTYSKYGRCDDSTCTEVTINNVHTGWYNDATNKKFDNQWEYSAPITGCAGDTVSASVASNSGDCTNKYNSSKGYLASTTGNITGIYDMSGGSWEYVMGVIEDADGNLYSGRNSKYNSGFKGLYGCPTCDSDTSGLTSNTTGLNFPDTKYYDAYVRADAISTDKWYDYTAGKLGDATKEVANTKANSTSGDRGLWFNDYAYFATPAYPWFGRGGCWGNGSGAGVFYFSRDNGHALGNVSARSVLAY